MTREVVPFQNGDAYWKEKLTGCTILFSSRVLFATLFFGGYLTNLRKEGID
jgi:hypothetical protein